MLSQLALFSDLHNEALERLAVNSYWQVHRRREIVAEPGENEHELYVIVEGIVGITAVSSWGEEFIALLLDAGDLFALLHLPPSLRETLYAQAMSDAVLVYHLPEREFRDAKHACPGMWGSIERQANEHAHAVSELLLDFVFYDTQTRFAHILSRLAERDQGHVVRFTHDELGRLTGLSRAKVTGFLVQLRRKGLVSYGVKGQGITVSDPSALYDTTVIANSAFRK